MKYLLLFFSIIITTKVFAGDSADVLILHGKLLDGTGNSWYYGDVAITNGKIISIGNLATWHAEKVIDASGYIVAPGFIDVHTHIEKDEAKNPYAENFLLDGVTTVITGNCGSSHINIKEYFSFLDSL